MIPEERVKQFQEAVIKDYGPEAALNFEDARKVLEGTASYLLTLEKIWLRMQDKKATNKKEPDKSSFLFLSHLKI